MVVSKTLSLHVIKATAVTKANPARATVGGVRTVITRHDNGSIRVVDAMTGVCAAATRVAAAAFVTAAPATVACVTGLTRWRSSAAEGAVVSVALDSILGNGIVVVGTDDGVMEALDELVRLATACAINGRPRLTALCCYCRRRRGYGRWQASLAPSTTSPLQSCFGGDPGVAPAWSAHTL